MWRGDKDELQRQRTEEGGGGGEGRGEERRDTGQRIRKAVV